MGVSWTLGQFDAMWICDIVLLVVQWDTAGVLSGLTALARAVDLLEHHCLLGKLLITAQHQEATMLFLEHLYRCGNSTQG